MQEFPRIAHAESLDDLGADFFRSSRGHGQHHRAIECFDDVAKFEVIWPEIMAPVTDAVRLIDGEEGDARAAEAIEGFRIAELLRRQKDEFDFTFGDAVQSFLMFGGAEGRIYDGGLVEF